MVTKGGSLFCFTVLESGSLEQHRQTVWNHYTMEDIATRIETYIENAPNADESLTIVIDPLSLRLGDIDSWVPAPTLQVDIAKRHYNLALRDTQRGGPISWWTTAFPLNPGLPVYWTITHIVPCLQLTLYQQAARVEDIVAMTFYIQQDRPRRLICRMGLLYQ